MALRTERVVLDITYDDATQKAPTTWTWSRGQTIPRGVAELVTIYGRPATGRLDTALRDDLVTARKSLDLMATRAVTAEAEVEGWRAAVTAALKSWDDPGVARALLSRALKGGRL